MLPITLADADSLFTGPIIAQRERDGLSPLTELPPVFPNMRASAMCLAFHEDYLGALADWFEEWQASTGFVYRPGSGMCESGVKQVIAAVDLDVLPWRGFGPVDDAVLREAEKHGKALLREKQGDITGPDRRLHIVIPAGASINGVADGGHATLGMIVHNDEGECYAAVWEWQNGHFTRWDEAVNRGIQLADCID